MIPNNSEMAVQLTGRLSSLFTGETVEAARRLAGEAGIKELPAELRGSEKDVWAAVLDLANSQGKTEQFTQRLLQTFPSDEVLQRAYRMEIASGLSGVASKVAGLIQELQSSLPEAGRLLEVLAELIGTYGVIEQSRGRVEQADGDASIKARVVGEHGQVKRMVDRAVDAVQLFHQLTSASEDRLIGTVDGRLPLDENARDLTTLLRARRSVLDRLNGVRDRVRDLTSQ